MYRNPKRGKQAPAQEKINKLLGENSATNYSDKNRPIRPLFVFLRHAVCTLAAELPASTADEPIATLHSQTNFKAPPERAVTTRPANPSSALRPPESVNLRPST